MNLQQYFPVLLFIGVATLIGFALLTAGSCSARAGPTLKAFPYECGFEAFEDARMKFDVRYYLVAILFILFDLEIAFLFPGPSLKAPLESSASGRSWFSSPC